MFGKKARMGESEMDVIKQSIQLSTFHQRPTLSLVPREKLAEVYGEVSSPPSPDQIEIDCEALERQVNSILSYLDKKQYVKIYNLEGGTSALFKQVVTELSERLPLVSGEMKDMVSLTRNIAHFFRVLEKKRIDLLRKIITNETEIAEPVMATFFPGLCPATDVFKPNRGAPPWRPYINMQAFFEHAGRKELPVEKGLQGQGFDELLLCSHPGQSKPRNVEPTWH